MKIGIIGAGYVGRAVAKHAIKSGHQVMICNSRSVNTLSNLAAELGCTPGTREDAIEFGDVVVIAIPYHAYPSLPARALANKVVIDTGNYAPERDGRIEALDQKQATTTGLLAAHLSTAGNTVRIAKAFNAIKMSDFEMDGKPARTPGRRALPIAANDPLARDIAIQLTEEFGFDALDTGSLEESWRFERGTPAYCVPMTLPELKTVLDKTDRDTLHPGGVKLP
ncbi:NADPH-dependent F420 reductase [Thalassospira sp. TSL5-1]|uniref:NADPH-dependent F420 reductase n=1 Tax=Thalassospira sp. TSL5-1 TaxID=1544451 RepID=UPI00093B832D|nr:NAD(P)-binding domain-containing protein [Thalassospira sp. TSL5-1]OKH87365.1 NADP oxidoreductase [Thalassospira sp. TSL5-1]